MTKVNTKDVDKYFRQATDWDIDQIQRTKASERRAWIVAGVFGLVALLSTGANYMLFPLKQIEYRIVRVDEGAGIVDVQRTTLSSTKTTEKEATDRYWLRLYVRQREGWLFDSYDETYRTVGLLSSAEGQKAWQAFWSASNPTAPVNKYGNAARVKVKIRSVSFIGKNLASIRFTKILEQKNAKPTESYWIATVPYRYVNAPLSDADREINPLGFQVTEGYRVDQETDVIRPVETNE